jgi:hypothetical protein
VEETPGADGVTRGRLVGGTSYFKLGPDDIQVTGGLLKVARRADDRYESIDDPAPTLETLRDSGERVDIFTFMQKLPETSPKYDFHMEWDNVAALAVTTYDRWWTAQVNAKTRNVVRRSERAGVAVREVLFDDQLAQGISGIYNETPIRQGKPFPHFGKAPDAVRRDNGTFPDQSIFLGAYLRERLIGFAKLVRDHDNRQAGLMQILSMIRHRDKAPTNALIAHSVRVCAERQIEHLLYASFSYGNKQRDGLSDFKRHNGFQRIELPRYYIPLTPTGRVALRFGLHHRLADRFPEPLLARLRTARRFWYARRLQADKP